MQKWQTYDLADDQQYAWFITCLVKKYPFLDCVVSVDEKWFWYENKNMTFFGLTKTCITLLNLQNGSLLSKNPLEYLVVL